MPCYNTLMKLIRTFDITSDAFYDHLEEQLLESIQKATGRKVTRKVIRKGYVFEDRNSHAKVTIDNYLRGCIYETTMRAFTSYIRVTYRTKETPEGLQIEFEQFVSGTDDRLEKMNFLSRQWHSWISFGRMSRTLYDMVNDIRNGKSGNSKLIPKQPEPFRFLRKRLEKKYSEQN